LKIRNFAKSRNFRWSPTSKVKGVVGSQYLAIFEDLILKYSNTYLSQNSAQKSESCSLLVFNSARQHFDLAAPPSGYALGLVSYQRRWSLPLVKSSSYIAFAMFLKAWSLKPRLVKCNICCERLINVPTSTHYATSYGVASTLCWARYLAHISP